MVHHYTRLALALMLVLCLLLIPAGAWAAGTKVNITVSVFIVGAPGGFTVTYISEYEVGLSWTKGEDAENTMIRAAIGRMPEDREDGYLVYYGDGESATDWVNMETLSEPIYYRAWSERADGKWEDGETTGFVEGIGMILGCSIGLALGLSALAVWRKHFLLYLLAFIGLLIIAAHVSDTAIYVSIPLWLVSGYMFWECVTWWF